MAAFSKAHLAGLLAVLTGAAVLAGCGTDSTSSGGGGGVGMETGATCAPHPAKRPAKASTAARCSNLMQSLRTHGHQ